MESIDVILQCNIDIAKWGGDRRKIHWQPVSSLLPIDITEERWTVAFLLANEYLYKGKESYNLRSGGRGKHTSYVPEI